MIFNAVTFFIQIFGLNIFSVYLQFVWYDRKSKNAQLDCFFCGQEFLDWYNYGLFYREPSENSYSFCPVCPKLLQPFEGLVEHVREVRKKIRQMMAIQSYQEGISEMLVSKDNFQIKNKILKLGNESFNGDPREIYVQIRISAIEKCSCQTYNQQLWQFGIIVSENKSSKKNQALAAAVVELMEFVLKHLQCSNLLPLNKQKNRYMLDHKVIIAEKESDLPIYKFQNMANQEVVLIREQTNNFHKLAAKYFYNDRKNQQSLKQIIMNRSLETSGNSKKNSTDSTDTSRRVSLYEYYDDELDITVLSGSDMGEERGEEIYLDIPHSFESQEFQILMEETLNDDELFLKDNLSLFKQLGSLQNSYF